MVCIAQKRDLSSPVVAVEAVSAHLSQYAEIALQRSETGCTLCVWLRLSVCFAPCSSMAHELTGCMWCHSSEWM